uniref:Putative secreted protein n=1 Tax=Anopheles darlingi TaxID=43151 RepID=A0A2M4D344_ANODA
MFWRKMEPPRTGLLLLWIDRTISFRGFRKRSPHSTSPMVSPKLFSQNLFQQGIGRPGWSRTRDMVQFLDFYSSTRPDQVCESPRSVQSPQPKPVQNKNKTQTNRTDRTKDARWALEPKLSIVPLC